MRFDLLIDGKINKVELWIGKSVTVRLDGMDFLVDVTDDEKGMAVHLDGRTFRVNFEGSSVSINGHRHMFKVRNLRRTQSPALHTNARLRNGDHGALSKRSIKEDEIIYSPLPGSVIAIKVKPGDRVKEGETILVLEAMKMQNEIISHTEGIIREIRVAEGDLLESGSVMVVIGH